MNSSPHVQASSVPAVSEPTVAASTAALDVVACTVIEPLYLDRQLATGEPLREHAEGLVSIVRPLRAEPDLLAAGYLFAAYDVLRDPDDWLRGRFGASVAQLVADLRQLMRLSERTRGKAGGDGSTLYPDEQTEALRRMLLAMCNDLRVVLLRLASRLQTLRWFSRQGAAADPVLRQRLARETLALYAPLANRLGIWQLKWELEDLAFRYIQPDVYKQIARQLDGKRIERERFIDQVQQDLIDTLHNAGIKAQVSGRPKHIYSIWHKMKAKELAFDELYDVRGLRVIVSEVAQCYQVLSLVHQRFTPLREEFDDYIARPKANGYQSLHTVVLDGEGRPIEIQIRTQQMHELAELGLAAHWRYKEGGSKDSGDVERIAWLRQLLAWRDDVEVPAQSGMVEHRIYVLTPQARVVELPAGSTPIDFAYHVHTELGHRCRGAKIDGAMVPLNTPLKTGQTVEISAAKTGGPSRDWLNVELGFLASQRSRAKVRSWFNAQELQQSVLAGRAIIEQELARLGKSATKLDELAKRLSFNTVDDLFVAATKEEFSLRSIEQALKQTQQPAAEIDPASLLGRSRVVTPAKGQVLVVGVDSLMTSLARCCRPVPPDEITGFVTRGKGVSIHRVGCANAHALARRQPERLIDVAWGGVDALYPVDLFVLAQDRQGLLRDISEVFAREKLNMVGVNTLTQRGEAQMQFTVEVSDSAAVRRALNQVAEVRGVISARRR